jgi:hypothetical protein
MVGMALQILNELLEEERRSEQHHLKSMLLHKNVFTHLQTLLQIPDTTHLVRSAMVNLLVALVSDSNKECVSAIIAGTIL